MDPEGWGHQSNPEQILQAPVGSNAMLLCIWVRVRPHLSKHNLPCYNLWTFQQTLKHLFICKWMSSSKKKKESPSKTELGRLLSQWPAEKKMSVLLITHRLSRLHQWTPWVSFEAMLSCNQGSTVSLSWPVLCGFHQEPKTEPTRNPMCWEIWWKTLKKVFF